METTWIVVADSSRARVFEQGGKHLREIEDMLNPGGRAGMPLKVDDGKSHDKNKRIQSQGGEAASGPVAHENQAFARSIGHYLEQARMAHRYRSLRLIAAPKFLGLMRGELNKEVQKMVAQELPKDITMFSRHQIEAYLHEQPTQRIIAH